MKRTPAGRGRPARTRSASRGHGLHPLALRLELAREEERARVARELHDELGQVLTSLKLEFMWLVDRAAEERAEAGHSARQQAAVVDRADRSQHPVGPADLERLAAGGARSSRTARGDSVGSDEVRGADRHSMPRVVGAEARAGRSHAALALFRILQEALTNVVRHAHAGAVRISVRERGRTLTLTMRDNGRGITKAELSSVESIGLLGMTERARLLGGRVTIAGVPGRGTTSRSPFRDTRRTTRGRGASDMTRILLVDDHPVVRQGIKQVLRARFIPRSSARRRTPKKGMTEIAQHRVGRDGARPLAAGHRAASIC